MNFAWPTLGAGLLSSLVFAGPAAAAPVADAPTVAVLPLRVTGDMSEVARVRVEEALVDGLGRGGAEVLGPAQTRDAAGVDCTTSKCLEPVFESLAADYVAWVDLSVSGRDYEIALRVQSKNGSESLSTSTCEICGFDEVASTLRGEANAMAEKLERLDAPGSLIVSSEPAGAELLVDGVVVGETPVTYELAPGAHVLTLRKEGFATREQKLSVESGVQERLLLDLTAVESAKPVRKRQVAGWALVGVGVAGVAAGATLFAFHHRPIESRCDDPAAIDVNGLCRWRYNMLAPGIASLGVGLAALGAGVGLVVRDRKRSRMDTARQARTRVAVSPWSIELSGHF